jgi:hypothetical protein
MKKTILLSVLLIMTCMMFAATGEYYETGKGLMGKKLFTSDTFRDNWTVIQTLNLNNDGLDDLFLYDPITGEGEFYLFKNNTLDKITTITGFRKTWKAITPIDANGDGIDELLFYDPIDATCELYKVDMTKKTIVSVRNWPKNKWRKNWKSFVPINLDADAAQELFLYDPVTGTGEFLDFTADNNVKSILIQTGFRKQWRTVREINLNNDGISDLFFYDHVAGVGECYSLSTPFKTIKPKKASKTKKLSVASLVSTEITVKMTLTDSNNTFRKNWRTVIVGDFGSGKKMGDMFLYDPVTGEGEFYAIGDKGVLKPLSETKPGFRKNWSIILKGKFSSAPGHGLFFYETKDFVTNYKKIFGVNPY